MEEYLVILSYLQDGKRPPTLPAMHHHLLWLSDAFTHAASIRQTTDFAETDITHRAEQFFKHFQEYYLKAVEMAGFLRTQLHHFPALTRFNSQVELEMNLFLAFIQEVAEMDLKYEFLGSLTPLLPDHMVREQCYYLQKLAEVSEVQASVCDPTRPRIEV